MTPCFMWVLAMDALNCCTIAFFCIMFSCTLSASGFPFAVCSAVAVLTAVEALHYLELWSESYWLVEMIVDVTPVFETSVCYMVVVEVDYDRAMFRVAGSLFVLASQIRDFGDGSAREAIGDFE